MKAGGVDAVVPQTTSDGGATQAATAPVIGAITSGRDLLDQARQLLKASVSRPGSRFNSPFRSARMMAASVSFPDFISPS